VVPIREAAGFEGLIILGVIYFVLNLLQKAGKSAARTAASPEAKVSSAAPATQEDLSLQGILREIERLKQQKQGAPPPMRQKLPRGPKPAPKARRQLPGAEPGRGPMGRRSQVALTGAEEVEDRTDYDDLASSRVDETGRESYAALELRRQRPEFDEGDAAEELIQRRIREAEERNGPISAADHRQFDAEIRAPGAPSARPARMTRATLRQAFVWREILGPPKALEE